MKTVLKLLSYIALGLTIIPSLLVWHGIISWNLNADLMTVGVFLWFGTAPFWMKKAE